MSISEGFEKKIHTFSADWDGAYQEYGYTTQDIDKLLAYTRQLEAHDITVTEMLRKHEWSADSPEGYAMCPECQGKEMSGYPVGHAPDCQLAKLVGEEIK